MRTAGFVEVANSARESTFPCRARVYPVLASISLKVLKLLCKLRVTVSCPVTGDQPGKLIPPVAHGEKENCNFSGTSFHQSLSSLHMEPGITLATVFAVLTSLLFIAVLHSRTMKGLLMLRLNDNTGRTKSKCACAAPSILPCCDRFAKTRAHVKFDILFFILLNSLLQCYFMRGLVIAINYKTI